MEVIRVCACQSSVLERDVSTGENQPLLQLLLDQGTAFGCGFPVVQLLSFVPAGEGEPQALGGRVRRRDGPRETMARRFRGACARSLSLPVVSGLEDSAAALLDFQILRLWSGLTTVLLTSGAPGMSGRLRWPKEKPVQSSSAGDVSSSVFVAPKQRPAAGATPVSFANALGWGRKRWDGSALVAQGRGTSGCSRCLQLVGAPRWPTGRLGRSSRRGTPEAAAPSHRVLKLAGKHKAACGR